MGKIIFCTLLAVGLAVVYLHYAPSVYTSTALLEVTQNQGKSAAELDASDTQRTLELKFASRPILQAVVTSQQLATDPDFLPGPTLPMLGSGLLADLGRLVRSGDDAQEARAGIVPRRDIDLIRQLSTQVSVASVRGSRLIILSVQARTPQLAQRLAQSMITEFYNQSREQNRSQSTSSRDLLMTEARRVGQELKESEEKLQAYRDTNNAVSLQDRQNIVVERLRDLNQQVAVAKNSRVAMESQQERITNWMDTDPDRLLSIQAIADLPEITDLRKQVTSQEGQMATLMQRYGPLHPTMIQAKSQLKELQASLRSALRKASSRLIQTYESAKSTEAALVTALNEQEKASLELDRIAIPYRGIEREVQANATAYQKVLDGLKQADLNHGLLSDNDVDGIDVRIVDQPVLPIHPTGPRSKLLLGISALAGLVVGCGLALFSRAMDNSVNSVDEAESLFNLAVLGTVPRTRRKNLKAGPVVERNPASGQAEAFRSLRTALSLQGDDDARRCVLFTSAVPGEGKSFCSFNYAASLAQQDFRTLLIDGDLRRPSLQWVFGDRDDKPGLSDCIRKPELFTKAVQTSKTKNLFRLGDWQHEAGSAELLAKGGLSEIIRLGLASYDRVVIDTAPLMAVSDTLYIVRNVSTICLVVCAGKTSRRHVRRSLRMLEDVIKRPVTGLVLNKVGTRSSADHYYYYNP